MLALLPFPSSVPFVSVTLLVDPIVKASARRQDPPTPLKMIGLSNVTPEEVIVFGPEVAANVMAFVVAVNTVEAPDVKSPKTVTACDPTVPANPLKLKFL
jgi:hypothetical protein